MKDLSRLDVPKKVNNDIQQEPEKPKTSKKKLILIVAIVCLLSIAIASKLINKHLKKIKAEEKAKAELQIEEKQKTTKTKTEAKDAKGKEDAKKDIVAEKSPNGSKMVFTFYDNLKHESVTVDAEPQSARAQYKYTYIYQVASFRNMNETSWYVKKMKAAGLDPKFKQVGSWIRMYIGPYDSTRAIAPDIIKLQRLGLNGGFTREISKTKIEPKDDKKTQDKSKSKPDDSDKNNSKPK